MEYLVKLSCEAIQSRVFVSWDFFDYYFNFTCVICLFKFSDSSWFSFGRFYVSRNPSISSRLSRFWHIVVHNIFLQPFVLSCYFSFFMSDYIYLGHLSLFFSWWIWLKVCQSCLSFWRTSSWIHWYVIFF